MPQLPSLLDLFKSGVHFGHQLSKRYPKMQPYIFGVKNGIHIINLELTLQKLSEALGYIEQTVADGGTVLFVGTKEQAKPIVSKYAAAVGMPYVTERWLGGTFTNFGEVSRVVHRFQDLKRKRETGELEKYTKKERLDFDREIERLERFVGGIEHMKKIPEALFVVDVKYEEIAIAEADRKGVNVVAICDTNVNPTKVKYIIPGNDDAIKSIDLITRLASEAVSSGLKRREATGVSAVGAKVKAAAPANDAAKVSAV
ncbi:MAG: 30S ribosomal protein S2 [Patescibacteria group bacterium]|nr:30S ribosomal protein S2 [Patescibacteria group bacterium]